MQGLLFPTAFGAGNKSELISGKTGINRSVDIARSGKTGIKDPQIALTPA